MRGTSTNTVISIILEHITTFYHNKTKIINIELYLKTKFERSAVLQLDQGHGDLYVGPGDLPCLLPVFGDLDENGGPLLVLALDEAGGGFGSGLLAPVDRLRELLAAVPTLLVQEGLAQPALLRELNRVLAGLLHGAAKFQGRAALAVRVRFDGRVFVVL